METNLLSFDIPAELIAQKPIYQRGSSRLMLLERKNRSLCHHQFSELPNLLEPGSLLVFNNVKVRKARIKAKLKQDRLNCELLFLEQKGDLIWEAIGKPLKKLKPGTELELPEGLKALVKEQKEGLLWLETSTKLSEQYFARNGILPLPPYIKRNANLTDEERYQTILAKESGAVAAPTAGLHFTPELLAELKNRGFKITELTLWVGLGTFQPIRTKTIEEHKMHKERFFLSEDCVLQLNTALKEKRPIVAVGTTSVRALESAALEKIELEPGERETDLYIKPGFQFKVVKNLITNFHMPCSSLLVLVSAFAGYEFIYQAYREAVEKKYRFFSYGDAMLIR